MIAYEISPQEDAIPEEVRVGVKLQFTTAKDRKDKDRKPFTNMRQYFFPKMTSIKDFYKEIFAKFRFVLDDHFPQEKK